MVEGIEAFPAVTETNAEVVSTEDALPDPSVPILQSLTMSDLNELRPLVVDDIIVEAAAGKFPQMTSRDVLIMMNDKVHNVFDN